MSPPLNELSELAQEIRSYLCLRTYIVGVKLLKSADELPRRALRPLKTFGVRLPTCRALNVARTYGWTIGQVLDDMFCVLGAAAFGMIERPDYLLDSGLVGQHARNGEAGKTLYEALRARFLEPGACEAVLFMPMHKLALEPDVVVAYGTPTQVAILLKAIAWSGVVPEAQFVSIAACSAITYALKHGKPTFTLPCAGERLLGLTEEGEVWAAFGPELLPVVAEGVRAVRKIFPYPPIQVPIAEPTAPEWYPMRLEDYRAWLRRQS